jgi:hypothetical protein
MITCEGAERHAEYADNGRKSAYTILDAGRAGTMHPEAR